MGAWWPACCADMRPCACLNCTLQRLTDEIIAERIWRGMGMALEIKGLKAKAVKTGAMFDRLNVAYDKLLDTGTAHAADVESLPAQIDGMQDDLQFMVQALGNSTGGSSNSGEGVDKPKPAPAAEQPKTEAVAPPPAVTAAPEVVTETAATFQHEG